MYKNRYGSGRNMEMRARGLQKPVHCVLFCSFSHHFYRGNKNETAREREGWQGNQLESESTSTVASTDCSLTVFMGREEKIWSSLLLLASRKGRSLQSKGSPADSTPSHFISGPNPPKEQTQPDFLHSSLRWPSWKHPTLQEFSGENVLSISLSVFLCLPLCLCLSHTCACVHTHNPAIQQLCNPQEAPHNFLPREQRTKKNERVWTT